MDYIITRLKKVPENIAKRCEAFNIEIKNPNDLNMTCYEFKNVPNCLVFALKRIITMYTYSIAYDYNSIIIENNKSNHFIDTIKHRVQFIKIEQDPIYCIDKLYCGDAPKFGKKYIQNKGAFNEFDEIKNSSIGVLKDTVEIRAKKSYGNGIDHTRYIKYNVIYNYNKNISNLCIEQLYYNYIDSNIDDLVKHSIFVLYRMIKYTFNKLKGKKNDDRTKIEGCNETIGNILENTLCYSYIIDSKDKKSIIVKNINSEEGILYLLNYLDILNKLTENKIHLEDEEVDDEDEEDDGDKEDGDKEDGEEDDQEDGDGVEEDGEDDQEIGDGVEEDGEGDE